MNEQLTLTKPDDSLRHERDGDMLERVVPDSTRRVGRAITVPNLRPQIPSTELTGFYRDRILDAVPYGKNFQPLMKLFLNAIFERGLRPHHYCRPVLKREQDRLADVQAFIKHMPQSNYCAKVFERASALDRREAFGIFHGADLYS